MENTRLFQEPPRLSQALERVVILRKSYRQAVQRLIADGDPLAVELLVRPVDMAGACATAALAEWRSGDGTEQDAVDAQDIVARLMVNVIRRAR